MHKAAVVPSLGRNLSSGLLQLLSASCSRSCVLIFEEKKIPLRAYNAAGLRKPCPGLSACLNCFLLLSASRKQEDQHM